MVDPHKTVRLDLADQLNTWLEENLTPARTASGAVSRRRGLLQFDDSDRLRLLLGGTFGNAIDAIRLGQSAPFRAERAVRELIGAGTVDEVLRLRRDQAVMRDCSHAGRHTAMFGHAPDGGTLPRWVDRNVQRNSQVYRTTTPLGPEAAHLVETICPAPAPANARRRRRHHQPHRRTA